jgi:two-component system response regulator FixJ
MIASEIIHLIDDDSEICRSLELLLNIEGYTVYIYNSARSFLDNITQNESGCILTDVRMPGMNGIDLLTTLKQRGVIMPVIVMSGFANTELEIMARSLGAFEYFEKPYDPDILLAAIRHALTRSNRQIEFVPLRQIEIAQKRQEVP